MEYPTNFVRKMLGAVTTGFIVYLDPLSYTSLPQTMIMEVAQAAAASLVGGSFAGYDLGTTWILRLSVSTGLGYLGGALTGRVYAVSYLPAIGAASGFIGTIMWPDRHPLFN